MRAKPVSDDYAFAIPVEPDDDAARFHFYVWVPFRLQMRHPISLPKLLFRCLRWRKMGHKVGEFGYIFDIGRVVFIVERRRIVWLGKY